MAIRLLPPLPKFKFQDLTPAVLLLLPALAPAAENNDFYDNTEAVLLEPAALTVAGEVDNPGEVDFSQLPVRSVIVKEALRDGNGSRFVGAYRYDGYSLYDILKERFVAKKNAGEFPPIIDLYVLIENAKGEKVAASWGEIFYPTRRHEIIVAGAAATILPSFAKDKWPVPQKSKLVFAGDILTHRNIELPTRITVLSAPLSFPTQKGLSPMYQPSVALFAQDKKIGELAALGGKLEGRSYPSIFYGRGKGFHGVRDFRGRLLREVLSSYYPLNEADIAGGLLVVSALDGYRAAFSYSEVFNRNDQAESLFVDEGKGADGGRFAIFPAPDFFSDRAIKSVKEIHLLRAGK